MSPTTISPKVKWATFWAGIIGLLTIGAQGAIAAITPDSLGFLGIYAPIGQAILTVAAAAIAGYKTTDPARVQDHTPPLDVTAPLNSTTTLSAGEVSLDRVSEPEALEVSAPEVIADTPAATGPRHAS